MSDRLIEPARVREERATSVGFCLTARLSDMFEANGLSIGASDVRKGNPGRCRAVSIDNESDQVP